jgi:hypothetical protein
MFATTWYHVACGDIGKEKTFFNLSSPAKPRLNTEDVLKT